MNKGKYWEELDTIHEDEPIIEGEYFDLVKVFMIDEMKSGRDNSELILRALRDGANKYLEECMKNDPTIINEGQAGDDLEEDRAKRNSDLIKDELLRNTAAIYGVE